MNIKDVRVTSDNCTEDKLHEFTTEASDIGLPPCQWPELIPTDIGNKQPFILRRIDRDGGGDVVCAVYQQSCGCAWLYVYND